MCPASLLLSAVAKFIFDVLDLKEHCRRDGMCRHSSVQLGEFQFQLCDTLRNLSVGQHPHLHPGSTCVPLGSCLPALFTLHMIGALQKPPGPQRYPASPQ